MLLLTVIISGKILLVNGELYFISVIKHKNWRRKVMKSNEGNIIHFKFIFTYKYDRKLLLYPFLEDGLTL